MSDVKQAGNAKSTHAGFFSSMRYNRCPNLGTEKMM